MTSTISEVALSLRVGRGVGETIGGFGMREG
jgi:hypothetical protein